MNEIKFRAWDTHEEVMNRVDYVDFVDGVIGMSNENVRDYEQPIHRVNIMQPTGLKDKNGVEVYEGDIVRRRDFHCDEVYFYVGQINYSAVGVFAGQFVFRSQSGNLEGMYSRYGDEVIGNVFEDKELLEEEE